HLAGDLQIALAALVGQRLLVQAGVAQGDGGLAGDPDQQAQVLLGEPGPRPLGVQQDGAQGRAAVRQQRGAQQRARGHDADAVAVGELTRQVVAEDRFPFLQAAAGDAGAEAAAAGPGGAARVEGPDRQRAGGLVLQDDEGPARLPEEPEQLPDDPRQQLVQIQGGDQAVADLQDDPELLGRLRAEVIQAAVVVDGRLDAEG